MSKISLPSILIPLFLLTTLFSLAARGDDTIESVSGIGISFDAKSTTVEDHQVILGHKIDRKLKEALKTKIVDSGRYNADSNIKLWVSFSGYRLEPEMKLHEVDKLSAHLLFVKGNKTIKRVDDVTVYIKMKDVYSPKITHSDERVHISAVTYTGIESRVDGLVRALANRIDNTINHIVPETDRFGGVKGGFGRSRR
ncbi:hypothetical protein [Microbulbifer discodermiae]|uniref:hypothetical protein n=1 Tax=Microbulbifer sp. 2201CG32-9 TaxID=3232309 RepID=UPI00345BFF0A